jgi:outer membrane protein insertion porin family
MSRFSAMALALLAAANLAGAADDPAVEGAVDPSQALDLLGGVPLPEAEAGPGRDRAASGAGAEALLGRPIVAVRALHPPPGFDPAADAEIPLGATLDKALLRDAIHRLWGTGSYKRIDVFAEPEGSGAALVIRAEVLLRVLRLEVKGNKVLDDDDVARAIGYAPDRPIETTTEALLALRKALLDAYAERGYRDVRAVLTLESTAEPGRVALVAKIEEGPVDRYAEVSIRGLPEGVPLAAVLSRAKLRPGAARDRTRVEESRELLAEALASFGYFDAAVGAYTERRLSEHAFALEIEVVSGLPCSLAFEGFRRFRQRELEEIVTSKGRTRTAATAVESARAKIQSFLVSRGLLRARVRAERACFDAKGRAIVSAGLAPCGGGAVRQEIRFVGEEGAPVTVAAAVFGGNLRMTDAELDRELVAFVAQKNSRSGVFQPLNTRTIDDLGAAAPPPDRVGKARGALAPSTAPRDVYVPETYRAAAEHLTGLYRERGFLSASVVDTCDLAGRGPMRAAGETFLPFEVRRAPAEGEDEAAALPPCVFLNREKDLLLVVFGVSEGRQTRLNQLSFRGNDPSKFTERRLLDIAHLAQHDPYNEYRLREAARDIEAAYGRAGYVFADVTWTNRRSADGSAADVEFTVREGPRVVVKRVIVRGNAATSGRLIRDRLTLEPGDVITPDALSASEQRLMELGIFDSATVQMAAPDAAAAEKNLVVQVQESKPQYLELRGGVATVEGVRGGFEYGYRNLGGLAISARLRARANYRLMFPSKALKAFERRYENDLSLIERIERHLLVSVSTQHVPGTGGLLGLGIDVINERTNSPAFSADRTSGTFRVTSNRLRALPIELRTGVEKTNLELATDTTTLTASPQFQQWARLPEGDSLFSVTGITISLDFRDDVFNPSEGVFATIGADFVRSLANYDRKVVLGADKQPVVDPATGDVQYIDRFSNLLRAEASLSGYIPIIGKKMVLALSTSAGYIMPLRDDSTTWADRYFYVGGVSTLRGFPEDSLVPEDLYRDWKKKVLDYGDAADALLSQSGGESMFLARAEFRFPLAKGFYGGVFTEAGNIWRERTNLAKQFTLRPVTGLGIRYMTPIGPLAFDLGANLDKRPQEDRFAWYLSIGSAF